MYARSASKVIPSASSSTTLFWCKWKGTKPWFDTKPSGVWSFLQNVLLIAQEDNLYVFCTPKRGMRLQHCKMIGITDLGKALACNFWVRRYLIPLLSFGGLVIVCLQKKTKSTVSISTALSLWLIFAKPTTWDFGFSYLLFAVWDTESVHISRT